MSKDTWDSIVETLWECPNYVLDAIVEQAFIIRIQRHLATEEGKEQMDKGDLMSWAEHSHPSTKTSNVVPFKRKEE